jgi:hypothetical protein
MKQRTRIYYTEWQSDSRRAMPEPADLFAKVRSWEICQTKSRDRFWPNADCQLSTEAV